MGIGGVTPLVKMGIESALSFALVPFLLCPEVLEAFPSDILEEQGGRGARKAEEGDRMRGKDPENTGGKGDKADHVVSPGSHILF